MWNTNGELSDSGFTVAYSCVNGGYVGEGNISEDPVFSNKNDVKGTDEIYGTLDDGLMINLPSGCISTGSNKFYPERDLLGFKRLGPTSDIGAYAYQPRNNEFIDIISFDNKFISTPGFPVVTGLNEEKSVNSCLFAGYGRVIQIELPKNEYTDKKNQISVNVEGLGVDGKSIGNPQNINFYRIGTTQFFRSYYNETTRLGKIIVFTDNGGIEGEYPYAHVVKGAVGGKIRVSVARRQFK